MRRITLLNYLGEVINTIFSHNLIRGGDGYGGGLYRGRVEEKPRL
jgi:hypothetical protein